jgi:hypothetical protein
MAVGFVVPEEQVAINNHQQLTPPALFSAFADV